VNDTADHHSIRSRVRSLLGTKLALLAGLNLLVYGPYFFLQRHHYFPEVPMPLSFWDRLIPFTPQALWIYLSIYWLVPIGPFLMNSRKQILRYAIGVVLIGFIAELVFIAWPTTAPRPAVAGTDMAYRVLTTVDNPFHAFPSLHAAFSIYSALWGGAVLRDMGKSRWWTLLLWIWAALILYATLATKQHRAVDIFAGSVLGWGIYICVFFPWSLPRTNQAVAKVPVGRFLNGAYSKSNGGLSALIPAFSPGRRGNAPSVLRKLMAGFARNDGKNQKRSTAIPSPRGRGSG
jgi:membrane-associated phospholipid phosphatase